MDIQRKKIMVALLSVVSNTMLVGLKLTVGILIGSVSIISEAIHSGVDLLAAVIALFSVHQSAIPADKDHPYGHGKIENISGTVEALLIFAAAGWIIYEAVIKLMHPSTLDTLGWGVGVMLISAVANTLVSQLLFKVGKETDSVALLADAWHLRTDVYTSAGVMTGLAAIWAGRLWFPLTDLRWVDPVAAILVALLIIKAAYDLVVEAAKDLMDVGLPAEDVRLVVTMIESQRPLVHGYHHLRTRKAGHFRFIDFHIKVHPNMSVEDSHAITVDLSKRINEHLPNATVTIHIEPCNGHCDQNCLSGCFLETGDRPTPKHSDFASQKIES